MAVPDGESGAVVPAAAPRRTRPLAAEVDEGVMVLEHAARMKTKNRIVVDVLTGPATGPTVPTVEGWALHLIEQLEGLAVESETLARRLAVERDRAAATEGLARSHHDYRHLDTPNLNRRVLVCTQVGRVLREHAADSAVTHRLLVDARRMADDEIADAVGRVVRGPTPVLEAEDAALLAERLQQLATVDLPALARSRATRRGLRALLGGRRADRGSSR